ncbi:MAG: signal peptidase I [Lachnospiraceae bacterium]|nr:signal peptidase I [Lachnospiraceae bacterium]
MRIGPKPKAVSYGSLTFKRKEKKRIDFTIVYEVLTWLGGILAAVVLGAALTWFFGLKTNVVGTSMEPTLHHGEQVLLNRVSYQFTSPKRGDVVAFYPNGNTKTHIYIKRVIGLPGERIKIQDGYVYINDSRYFLDTAEITREAGIAENEIALGVDEYFVLGDNRSNTEDSRSANIGNITSEMIEGRVWLQLGTPSSKIRFVK